MTILELAEQIGLQKEMVKLIREACIPFAVVQDIYPKLFDKKNWEKTLSELRRHIGVDENGIKMLTIHLFVATQSYERYKQMGISDKIFVDTMKCFVRFVDQCKTVYRKWMFDREWWTVRQLSLSLFRIGMLEFELNEIMGMNCISMHIPSDAIITPEQCKISIRKAKDFIAKYFPQFNECPFVCDSWLLSPCLKILLPETSNIVKFLKMFEPRRIDEKSTDYMLYVFNTASKDLKNLPEKTTLQRNLKAHLLSGGVIGNTFGILKTDVPLLNAKLEQLKKDKLCAN